MHKDALFLPKGSIRAILVLVLTGFIIATVYFEKYIDEKIIYIWSGTLGWYFAGKFDDLNNRKDV